MDSDDPALRWLTTQDLAARRRIPHEGLGAAILAAQGEDGPWHHPEKPDWLCTLFMMLLLRATGVDPADVKEPVERVARGFRWAEEFDAKPFFEGEVEPCINGGTLALGGYFGHPSHDLAARLLRDQLPDGGWNCDAPTKSKVSSFHSTICVLEGLLAYERTTGRSTREARERAEAYLLERHLFRRLSTGAVVNPEFLAPAFPPRYRYDILRALDYFRDAGAAHDPRMDDALALLADAPFGSHVEAITVSIGDPAVWIRPRINRVQKYFSG